MKQVHGIYLIFALATNYAVKAIAVVELSPSRFFKRHYSSLLLAIGVDFTSRQNKKSQDIRKNRGKR